MPAAKYVAMESFRIVPLMIVLGMLCPASAAHSNVVSEKHANVCSGKTCEGASGMALLQKGLTKSGRWLSDVQLKSDAFNGTGVLGVPTRSLHSNAVSLLASFGVQIPDAKEFHFDSVSVTLRCVMWLSCLMLGAYSVLAYLRNSSDLSENSRKGDKTSSAVEILEVAIRSAPLAAALCALFVACRMYVLAHTAGMGSPPSWVRGCMILSTVGVTSQVFLAALLQSWLKEDVEIPLSALTGDPASAHPRIPKEQLLGDMQFQFASALQGFAVAAIYGGSVAIVVGILSFGNPLEVSPAIVSIVLLVACFLVCQAALGIANISNSVAAGTKAAAARAKKAPVIAVFFLAVRMRNLQVNPPSGIPPVWVWVSFYLAVAGLTLEVLSSLFCPGAVAAPSPSAEDHLINGRKSFLGKHLPTLAWRSSGGDSIPVISPAPPAPDGDQYSPAICVRIFQQLGAMIAFGGVAAVAYSLVVYGRELPLSTTMKCVLCLCGMNIGVYVLQWLASFTSQATALNAIEGTALSASVCVGHAPLLCILFVACRMRALQLTNQVGDPQWWAQDYMKLCVLAVFMQIICCILLPIFTGAATTVDSHGNAEYDLKPLFGAYLVQIVKYMALLFLYGGILAVCASICLMHEGMAEVEGTPRVSYGVRLAIQLIWVLVVIGIAALLSSAKVIGFVIKWIIEGLDECFLGVNIRVGKAALSLTRGYVFVSDLKVENPHETQFASPDMLKIEKMILKINTWRCVKTWFKEIEIEAIVLNGVEVNYEKEFFHVSNVGTVMDYIKGNSHHAEASAEAVVEKTTTPSVPPTNIGATASTQEPTVDIELHMLQIHDISAHLWVERRQLFSVHLGDIEEKDFAERHPGKSMPVEFIIVEVLKTILATVASNSHRFTHNVAEKAEGSLKKLASCLPCCEAADGPKPSTTEDGSN